VIKKCTKSKAKNQVSIPLFRTEPSRKADFATKGISKGGNYILEINTVLFQALDTPNLWQIRGTPPPILVAQERSPASQGGVNKSDQTDVCLAQRQPDFRRTSTM